MKHISLATAAAMFLLACIVNVFGTRPDVDAHISIVALIACVVFAGFSFLFSPTEER